MGCFGYICKHCNTPVRGNCFEGGEKCVLIHVRQGKELGRVVGHYNEYGTVIEEDKEDPTRFRGEEGINSHDEIHQSEFRLDDSIGKYDDYRYYNGELIRYKQYLTAKAEAIEDIEHSEVFAQLRDYYKQLVNKFDDAETRRFFAVDSVVNHWERKNEFWKEFYDGLPEYKSKDGLAQSGVAAYHHKCYQAAEKKGTLDLLPSDADPNQSWGPVRKKYK